VLPPAVTRRIVIEAGVTENWWRYAGMHGRIIGLDRFGESAPAEELFKHFGFSVDNVIRIANEIL
jgi:transketolase